MQVIRHSFKQTHTDHTRSPLLTVSNMLYVACVCLDVVQSSAMKKIHHFNPEAPELVGLFDDIYNEIAAL